MRKVLSGEQVRKFYVKKIPLSLFNRIEKFLAKGEYFLEFRSSDFKSAEAEADYQDRLNLLGTEVEVFGNYSLQDNGEGLIAFCVTGKGDEGIYLLDVSDYPYDIN